MLKCLGQYYGSVKIYYYEIFFEVGYPDGSIYSDWDNGNGFMPGETVQDEALIIIDDKEANYDIIYYYQLL